MSVHPQRSHPGMTSPDAAYVLSGELDMSTAETTHAAGRLALTSAGRGVVIDVSAVSFIDCAGLAPLVELAQMARARGGRITLVGARAGMRRLLAVTGLSDEFDLRPAVIDRGVLSARSPGQPRRG